MKIRLFLLTFLIFSAIAKPFAQPPDSNVIKVVSYNIWYDNPGNIDHPWLVRKDGVTETLLNMNPDIFCVQEALHHQVNDLEISSYKSFGVGRDDGKKGGEYATIFYDTTRFVLKQGGNFWLSEYPDSAGSIGWDAVCVRIATWVELKDKNSNLKFYVFNTHFDHVGDTARIESAKLLQHKVNIIASDHPVILTGDFNCLKGSQPYEILVDTLNKKPLRDCRYSSELKSKGPDYSFVGSEFTGQPGNIIDHIFVSKDIRVIKSEIIENCNQGKCPSDHLPVAAILELPKNAKHEK